MTTVRRRTTLLLVAGAALSLTACAGATAVGTAPTTTDPATSWSIVAAAAQGQTVNLWMYGGDDRGNAYVDKILAPAAAAQGVTIHRVPVADTVDALNRVISETQAGRTDDGSVDLVWVNGENFRTGEQAHVWKCGWATRLPNTSYLDNQDPLLLNDFGTPVNGCEAPWHKAQFVIAYDSAKVTAPPASIPELLTWAAAHPGRFTYPQPPDFTGSAFLRQSLYGISGGVSAVPSTYDAATAQPLEEKLWARLKAVAPSLWRSGQTYPRDLTALDRLYADGQVWFTMTYGPATVDARVKDGTFPATTRILALDGGTLGNASFLAIPANAAHAAAAEVVANLALSPEQQAAKADPTTWGQYTVLDIAKVSPPLRSRLEARSADSVVPPFSTLAAQSNPELSAGWVTPLEQGWRRSVLGG